MWTALGGGPQASRVSDSGKAATCKLPQGQGPQGLQGPQFLGNSTTWLLNRAGALRSSRLPDTELGPSVPGVWQCRDGFSGSVAPGQLPQMDCARLENPGLPDSWASQHSGAVLELQH
ncbi:tumor necrosis factor [Platysternon megacephalum]|uniref:Tumor necrosis factor n=1 Tax=Platysternon megacephalum TaxID=55544 RepID=A0A4D9DS94_9SAUR|nr:tumor necrosis factor [Platysternon megacephalum]